MDLFGATAGALLSAPLVAAIALLLLLEREGGVLYSQERIGRGGRRFRIWKFRTMRRDADRTPPPSSGCPDNRVTPLGRFLRRTGLNEVPQLLNILRGDMSFVGPRPDLPEAVAANEAALPRYHLRHLIPPGLTGPAQLYLSPYATEANKLRYDLLYVRRGYLIWDIFLIAYTFVLSFGAPWDSPQGSRSERRKQTRFR